ncbi:MAG: amidohydrolase/deacetylase family metallohydrolase [Daejeonella sp.]|uniref:amidohydrolase/deacetylase family metallohydrolase n=1 Tax=Daejeonella sp. JGW-45 TaxID=3034148 RepID=UPI0023EB14A4|nr:amidohydrolase/deacetylase family metallohydrolase [Daejeonella sp. JGW-45]
MQLPNRFNRNFFNSLLTACFVFSMALPASLKAQQIDLLLKGGHVIDPKNNIDGKMDVAIADGKIFKVAANIPANTAKKTVNVTGLYVTPGLIDIHGHVFHGTEPDHYLSNGLTALPPDGFTFRAGVTTVVDAGGAGWRNFALFKKNVIDESQTRVLAFMNIVGEGMRDLVGYEQNLADMDGKITGNVAIKYKPHVVGIKLAHYIGHDWAPTQKAVEAGTIADIPVMVDFGKANPPLPIEDLFLKYLRPGDIFTHVYRYDQEYDRSGKMVEHKQAIVDVKTKKVKPFVFEARKRGIIFDVGHGGGSFMWSQAVPAMQQGFGPDVLSSDLHTGSMNGGFKDMANLASKFLTLGMPLKDVIAASTWKPANVIKRPELGNLSEGMEADIAVFNLRNGDFGFLDSSGMALKGKQKLEAELTIRKGRVVWDLNAISAAAAGSN